MSRKVIQKSFFSKKKKEEGENDANVNSNSIIYASKKGKIKISTRSLGLLIRGGGSPNTYMYQGAHMRCDSFSMHYSGKQRYY